MPTIFSHAFFAAVVGKAALKKTLSRWFWLLTALCAVIPDADVIFYSFGAERGSMFSHRGFTHSIIFAVIFGALIAFVADKFLRTGISSLKLCLFFSLATLSHPLLDMLTDGGPGVALFAPFSNERHFFPWRPVEVSPIGLRFFGARGITVILSEFVWIWIPAIVVLAAVFAIRKSRESE